MDGGHKAHARQDRHTPAAQQQTRHSEQAHYKQADLSPGMSHGLCGRTPGKIVSPLHISSQHMCHRCCVEIPSTATSQTSCYVLMLKHSAKSKRDNTAPQPPT
jgi:hypothetical protein